MKIFAIGDLHLSFGENIEKPMDIFGGQWVGYTDRLEANWRQNISEEDLVIICGDISWGLRLEETKADFDWIKSLPGKKIFFKGNHDLWWQSAGKLNKVYGDENNIFVQNKAYIIEHEGKKIAICGSRGWICPGDDGFSAEDKKIYEREAMRLRMSFDEAKAQKALAEALKAQGFEIKKSQVRTPLGAIKAVGEYTLTIGLLGEIVADITVKVVAEAA